VITLRDDQNQFISDLRTQLRDHQAVLGQAPCGFGKTVVAAFIAKSVMDKSRRVIFGVHRRDLITQTCKTFAKFGIPYGVIASGYPMDLGRQVYVASIATLTNRMDRFKADLLVADEAHLSCSSGWSDAIDHYKSTGAHVIGLTATPERLDGQGLNRHFTSIVRGPTVRWLMDQGHLSTYRLFAPPGPNLDGVKSRAGDFASNELSAAMNKPSITGDAVSHYRKLAMGKRAMVFCVSIEHSIAVAEQFKQAGIMAAHIDGTTTPEDRKLAIMAFAKREINVLTNCSLCCEGFDMSAQCDMDCPIECVILLRPTQSLALYIQQVGRGLRRKPEPGIILDHSGNTMRHGLPCEDREWKLEGREKKKATETAIGVKICQKCFAALPSIAKNCQHCGFVFTAKERKLEQRDGTLEEVDVKAAKEIKRREEVKQQAKAQTLDDLIALGTARGYKRPSMWARHVFMSRNGLRA